MLRSLLANPQLVDDLTNVSLDDVAASNFCKPFRDRRTAERWHRILTAFFLPAITSGAHPYAAGALREAGSLLGIPILTALAPRAGFGFGPEVGDLWKRYLAGPRRQRRQPFVDPNSQIVKAFAQSESTKSHQEYLVQEIKGRLPGVCRNRRRPLLRRNQWTYVPAVRLLTRRLRRYPINFNVFTEIPGNIAGGVSSSDYGPDSRRVQGGISLYRQTDASGRTVGVRLRTGFTFVVHDAIDFCPGGIGAGIESVLTVPLSRLESMRPRMAHDVPFEVRYAGPVLTVDLDPRLVRRCFR